MEIDCALNVGTTDHRLGTLVEYQPANHRKHYPRPPQFGSIMESHAVMAGGQVATPRLDEHVRINVATVAEVQRQLTARQ